MARMPGAIWRPLAADWDRAPRMTSWDVFCLHTMVGSLEGTDAYFRHQNGEGYVGTEAHFGVGEDGTIFQWQDTAHQADANYRGGHRVISSENADKGTGFPVWTGSNVPAFTPAQVEANAHIAAWLWEEHGIPVDLIPDSKSGRRGMGWHRLGVPAHDGDTFSQTGGELWSLAPGKACPGDARIAQMPAISARARQLIDGEDDTMNAAQQALLEQTRNAVAQVAEQLGKVPAAVWGQALPGLAIPTPAGRVLVDTRIIATRTEAATLALGGELQQALVDEGADVTPEQLDAALRRVLGSLDDAAPVAG